MIVTPRAGLAMIPPPGAVPNNDTKWAEPGGSPRRLKQSGKWSMKQ